MTKRDVFFVAAGMLCLLGWAVSHTRGGNLTPPAGPVSSTMKTLDEVEPRVPINLVNTPGDADSVFKITVPGSYYLTENVVGEPGKSGIEITSSAVMLDLNGFSLIGVGGSVSGVSVSVDGISVSIRNGFIAGWESNAIETLGLVRAVCEDLIVLSSGVDGINVGQSSRVERCFASNCNADGIVVGAGSQVISCDASFNGGDGIRALEGSLITNSVAGANSGAGIGVIGRGTISGCITFLNLGGIAAIGGRIQFCVALSNTGDGIFLGSAGVVVDNEAASNQGHGIGVSASGALVARNLCIGNGSVVAGGISILGSRNQIDANTLISNTRGLLITDSTSLENIVMRNRVSNSTMNDYTIVAGNHVGLIVNPPASGAISGSSGGSGLGADRPWQNFAY